VKFCRHSGRFHSLALTSDGFIIGWGDNERGQATWPVTASIVERYSYDVYGRPTIKNASGTVLTTSAVGNRYMFTGREYDSETGNYYYRARYYSPNIGRFLQTDPVGYYDSMNLYQYCGNNPLNWADPLGLCKGGGYDYCSALSGEGGKLVQALSDGVYLTVYGASFGCIGDEQYVDQLEEQYGGFATASEVLGGVSTVSTAAAGATSYLGLCGGTTIEAIANNPSIRGGIGPVQLGQAGEEAVGLNGPRIAIEINGRTRIPDQIANNVLTEVKNVQNLSYTQQLRDYADYAQQNALKFELYTRSSTQLSGPLDAARNNGTMVIKHIPGM
jgi:RHS repeat-associated protein